jgi:hypothetical protein
MDASNNNSSNIAGVSNNKNGSQKRKERKERAREFADDTEEDAAQFWDQAEAVLLRPGVAGGLFGIGTSPALSPLAVFHNQPGSLTIAELTTDAQ